VSIFLFISLTLLCILFFHLSSVLSRSAPFVPKRCQKALRIFSWSVFSYTYCYHIEIRTNVPLGYIIMTSSKTSNWIIHQHVHLRWESQSHAPAHVLMRLYPIDKSLVCLSFFFFFYKC
jgi:hypothetical protein